MPAACLGTLTTKPAEEQAEISLVAKKRHEPLSSCPCRKRTRGDPKVPPGTLKRTFESMNFLKRGFKAAKSAVNAIFGVRARHP